MAKAVYHGEVARKKIKAGIDTLANAVTCTLGPYGRNVVIGQYGNYPSSTKDGVTVAKSISLEDPAENQGVLMIQQAAMQTANKAGDGTTTSTLLTQTLIKKAEEDLEKGGTLNLSMYRRGMEAACKDAVDFLKEELRQEISSEEDLLNVAIISANGDVDLGTHIQTALSEAGQDGVVTLETSPNGETYKKRVEGIQFQRGFKSPYFVTDTNTMQTVLSNPHIVLYDGKLTGLKETAQFLQQVAADNGQVLIIAEDIAEDILSMLIVNTSRGVLKACVVKAPEYGDEKTHNLEDIAAVTGGKVLSERKGYPNLATAKLEDCGKCQVVTVDKESTTIVGGQGKQEVIDKRIEDLKEQIANTKIPLQRERLQTRLSKMAGGVTVIYLGGASELEIKEKRDRAEDALHAAKMAFLYGIVPGGGIACIRVAEKLSEKVTKSLFAVDDASFKQGYYAFVSAMYAPTTKILSNAGISDQEIGTILMDLATISSASCDPWTGYNLKSIESTGKMEIVSMKNHGIFDPVKVTEEAITNAVSIAGTVILTESLVVDLPEQESKPNITYPGYE